MQAERSHQLLRKYCSYTFFNLLFIAAIANMFSKNLFNTLNKPLYYIHRVKNIEYIFFLASFTMVLYLQYEKYVQNISKKKLFILTFLSRMIFYSTFKIVLYFGFGLSVNYYRNFVLFIILNLWFALFDLFYYFSGKVNIKTYKPEGVIILFFKKSWTFLKESHKTMILPFILSFITYKSLRTICFNYILKKENSFFKEIFHYFISFLVCYISSFFFNFLHNLTIFSYDYNISNVDNCIFNDVKFEELEVHPLFFNKLMSCFEEMNTKIKIVKTKAVVNYLKKCMFLEVEKIKEILKKLEELYWNVQSTKYFLFTECRVVKKNQPDPVFKRLPTYNYIEIFKEEFKAFFIKKFYKFALNNSFEYLKEMYSFMEDADKQDGLFKLIDDVNYAVKKDLNNLKEKGVDLERKLGLFLWKDVLSQ